MTHSRHDQLLPEEDALDDPDEDDETDLTLPGDLWFRGWVGIGGRAGSRRVPSPPPKGYPALPARREGVC